MDGKLRNGREVLNIKWSKPVNEGYVLCGLYPFLYNVTPEYSLTWTTEGEHDVTLVKGSNPLDLVQIDGVPIEKAYYKLEMLGVKGEDEGEEADTTPEHYDSPITPIQYIFENNLNFAEGNVIKYVSRHRKKGGRQDLEKAISYLKLLIEDEYE